MSLAAALIYWVIVALWLTVLATIIFFYVRNPRADPEKLRKRATRMLALAITAQEKGDRDYSIELNKLASQVLAHAEEMERREKHSN